MSRGLVLICVLSALALAALTVRSDPWALAQLRAETDAAALSRDSSRSDRIGFYLGQDTALLKAVLWSPDGGLIYPGQDAYVPVQLELSDTELDEIAALLAGTDGSHWSYFDRRGQRLLYCQVDPALCLIYDRSELQASLGLLPGSLIPGISVRWLAMVGVAMLGLTSFLLFWRRRVRRDDSDALVLVPDRHSARRGGLEVVLTPRDYKVLELLKARKGGVVTKDELYDAGWGRDFMPNSRALDQYIINLRKKLDPDKSRATVIETVRGVGYRLVD